jgi:hypothetical protein
MVTAQFLGKIDHNSLLVQDDYIFVKVNKHTNVRASGVRMGAWRQNRIIIVRLPGKQRTNLGV